MENIEQYLTKDPKQIIYYLKKLLTDGCYISAVFGDNEGDTFLTVILDIDEKKQTITIDSGPKKYLNHKFQSSDLIKFSTTHKGINVLFEGNNIKQSDDPDALTYIIPIPSSIYWLQRRAFYRIKLPLASNSFCVFSLKESKDDSFSAHALRVYDLSADGFSVLNDSTNFSKQLAAAIKFDHCRLILEKDDISVSVKIVHKFKLIADKPTTTERIGCHIINSTPRIESTIQRCIQKINRESIHLQKG